MGLSPLARGSPPSPLRLFPSPGPIPARAGQPVSRRRRASLTRAYPRSRGAARLRRLARVMASGLSPLARGSHYLNLHDDFLFGPIPARAGQPAHHAAARREAGAYPRSRGAAAAAGQPGGCVRGLSPLARGSRAQSIGHAGPLGPIPARAGQPAVRRVGSCWTRAYPRSRGAAIEEAQSISKKSGLSPLARGSLLAEIEASRGDGPIPARAGQPRRAMIQIDTAGAYPRSRGAAPLSARMGAGVWGLSPLARGSLFLCPDRVTSGGPIPARAGQPTFPYRCQASARAYPRSRGAASLCYV